MKRYDLFNLESVISTVFGCVIIGNASVNELLKDFIMKHALNKILTKLKETKAYERVSEILY